MIVPQALFFAAISPRPVILEAHLAVISGRDS